MAKKMKGHWWNSNKKHHTGVNYHGHWNRYPPGLTTKGRIRYTYKARIPRRVRKRNHW